MAKSATKVAVSETLWRGLQPSWTLTSNKLRLTLTKHGLNIASVSLTDDKDNISPFWVPGWQWNDPSQVPHMNVTGDMEKLYGNHEESQLLSNICGHNMCIDRFGWCKSDDNPQRTCHGEAPIIPYNLSDNDNKPDTVIFTTTLSAAKLNMIRSFTFNDDDNSIEVSTNLQTATNEELKVTRKDVEWCEHVTLGDPFLNNAIFTADYIDCVYNFGKELPLSRYNNYDLAAKLPISVDECLSMPLIDDKSIEIEEVTSLKIGNNDQNEGSFKVLNYDLGYILEYNFNNKVFPWIAIWTEHYARKHAPWNGIQRARGMEFSTKPFPIAELEKEDVFKDKLYEKDGLLMFEGSPIEFVLPPQGRTETFSFRWDRL